MSKILIRVPMLDYGEYDVFHKTNFEELSKIIVQHYGGSCPNLGNRLWFQGIISEISTEENTIEYWDDALSVEEINEKYDMIVSPMANVFSEYCNDLMGRLADRLAGIKIPVYVIACGAQGNSYDDLPRLCDCIKDSAVRFIKAVYATGGEFALRGYFTKELFERLGFSSGVVTGCPSMFQVGRDLKIDNRKVDKEQLKPVFNGFLSGVTKAMDSYRDSVFMDQEIMYPYLYEKMVIGDKDYEFKRAFYFGFGLDGAKLLSENRIKLIPDMNDWYCYMKNEGFNYSFGSRIHGSIMPILSGVPATVLARDSRTREMAEFFDIPCTASVKKEYNEKDIFRLYEEADYTKFNKSFSAKYDAYERFLIDHGIVSKINDQNLFFDEQKGSTWFEEHIQNQQHFAVLYDELKRMRPRFMVDKIKRRIKGHF